jgi:hypothetical protein
MEPGSKVHKVYQRYVSGAFGEARSLAGEVLTAEPENFLALYLDGLAAYQLGDPIMGARRILEAERLRPEIESFGYLAPYLRQKGVKSPVAVLDARLNEYLFVKATRNIVVSYPKCGRTWLRFVLGSYVLNNEGSNPLELFDLTSQENEFAATNFTHDDYPHRKPFDTVCRDKSAYGQTRIALLVRDPRDVLVSYFFQYTKRGDKIEAGDPDFDGSLSDFIRHPIGGLLSLVAFYNAWAQNRDIPEDFLLTRYEDFHADPQREFGRLMTFLGWPKVDAGRLEGAISAGRFDNMKKLEESNHFKSARLYPPEDGDPEGFKVRRGKIGGYHDYLSPDDIKYIDDYLDDELDPLYDFYVRR